MAPKADLYAVRVFGCDGSTDVVVDAIDWAVDNDMDVINMSLGSPFGTADDASAMASTNAAKAGVVVVAAAGNNGLEPVHGRLARHRRRRDLGRGQRLDAELSRRVGDDPGRHDDPRSTPTASRFRRHDDVRQRETCDGTQPLGCSVAAFGGPLPPNTLVVVQRGVCARVAKAIFGQQAGAAAVLMVNNANALPPFEGPITSNPDDGTPFVVTIPFLGVSLADGPAFAAAAGARPPSSRSTSPTRPSSRWRASARADRATRTAASSLKSPRRAWRSSPRACGTGNGSLNDSGTSMATPHVTGVAALTVQAHPTWKVPDIKAAIVNTGAPTGVAGYRISSSGTGLVQPASSTKTQVVAEPNGEKLPRRSTSACRSSPTTSASRRRSSCRTTDRLGDLHGRQRQLAGQPASVTFNKSTVTVPAHGNATVNVSLNVPVATVGPADSGAGVPGSLRPRAVHAGIRKRQQRREPARAVLPGAAFAFQRSTSIGNLKGIDPSTVATVTNKKGAVTGDADFYAWGLGPKDDNRDQHNFPQCDQ